jgi:hypothetical protein
MEETQNSDDHVGSKRVRGFRAQAFYARCKVDPRPGKVLGVVTKWVVPRKCQIWNGHGEFLCPHQLDQRQ